MSDVSGPVKTVPDIIKDAGGPAAIAAASDGTLTIDAVYKWPGIGIPDRHWTLVMPLSGATADEMLAANVAARATKAERVA